MQPIYGSTPAQGREHSLKLIMICFVVSRYYTQKRLKKTSQKLRNHKLAAQTRSPTHICLGQLRECPPPTPTGKSQTIFLITLFLLPRPPLPHTRHANIKNPNTSSFFLLLFLKVNEEIFCVHFIQDRCVTRLRRRSFTTLHADSSALPWLDDNAKTLMTDCITSVLPNTFALSLISVLFLRSKSKKAT